MRQEGRTRKPHPVTPRHLSRRKTPCEPVMSSPRQRHSRSPAAPPAPRSPAPVPRPPTTRPSRQSAGRQEAGRPAQRRPGAGRHPLLDRRLRRPALQAGRRRQPPVVYKSKNGADGVSADGGVAPLRDRLRQQQVRRRLDPRRRRRAGAARRHLRLREGGQPGRQVPVRLPRDRKSCLAQLPKQIPASYSGVKETHPYAAATANGITYVADAGANAILASRAPASSHRRRPQAGQGEGHRTGAEANGLPNCTVGKKFALEAVPTDIEVRPRRPALRHQPAGRTGGRQPRPQRPGAEDRPGHRQGQTIVGGLLSPTGVAVASNGDIYVAQLFLGVISKIKAGKSKVKPYLRCRSRPRSR